MKVPGAAGRRGGRTKADWATTRRTLPQAGALYHGPVSHKGGPQPILLSPSGPPLSHPTKMLTTFSIFYFFTGTSIPIGEKKTAAGRRGGSPKEDWARGTPSLGSMPSPRVPSSREDGRNSSLAS